MDEPGLSVGLTCTVELAHGSCGFIAPLKPSSSAKTTVELRTKIKAKWTNVMPCYQVCCQKLESQRRAGTEAEPCRRQQPWPCLNSQMTLWACLSAVGQWALWKEEPDANQPKLMNILILYVILMDMNQGSVK